MQTQIHDFHNPDKLTSEQVGEGYRLLLKSEIIKRSPSVDIELWVGKSQEWIKSPLGFNGDSADITYRVLKWKKLPVKEPAPTDNDTWEILLHTNAQLGRKVAELEGIRGDLKTAADVLQEFEGSTVHEQAQQAVRRINELENQLASHPENSVLDRTITELQSKLTTAEARLKQLEWVPYSERKPTREDADNDGSVPVCGVKDGLFGWQPWDLVPEVGVTHWRPFAPPAPIDDDRVEFEKWWESNNSTYTTTGKEAVYGIWKAARAKEVKP